MVLKHVILCLLCAIQTASQHSITPSLALLQCVLRPNFVVTSKVRGLTSNWRCFWKQSNMTNYFIGIYSGFIGIYSGFNEICNLAGGFNLPLWKVMEFVNWDYDIPNVWKDKIHVPNHQSANVVNPTINHPQKSHINGWQDPSPNGRFTVGFTTLTTLGGDSDNFLGKKNM